MTVASGVQPLGSSPVIERDDTNAPRRAALRGAATALAIAGLVVTGVAVASQGDEPSSGTGSSTVASSTATTVAAATVAPTTLPVVAATSTAIPATTLPATTTTSAAVVTSTADPSAAAVTSLAPTTGAPVVDAAAYVVLDTSTGAWLGESAADEQRAVGSVIKLLTSYVVMQAGDPERTVTVPDLELDPDESAIGLYPGEQITRSVLLRAMLIVSANDAARTLAVDVGGSQDGFVAMMNDAAATLGLTGTVALNPIGLDTAGAHSTARDLATLAALLMQNGTFRATVARTSATLHGQTFPATNDAFLTTYPGADGVKTGHTTEAGYCLAASATRDGRRLVVVVLGSSSDDARVAAASALLDWGFAQV